MAVRDGLDPQIVKVGQAPFSGVTWLHIRHSPCLGLPTKGYYALTTGKMEIVPLCPDT